jgi:S1-C subfamily serine protease
LDKTSVVELETFVRRHGASAEAAYARAYLEELNKKQAAVGAPPKTLPPGVRGWLGINVSSVDAQNAARLSLRSPRGAVIVELSPGGPAALAGLQVDDVVVSINGADISDARAFATTVAGFAPDASLHIKIWRKSKEQVVSATLGMPPINPGHK